jgi:hypothetical protein
MPNKKVIKNSELSNLVYEAVVGITEEREHKGSYKGNGHHLAQEITAAVCKALEKAVNKNCSTNKTSNNKKWYGLKRGKGVREEILLVLFSRGDPITKEEFYHHDVPVDPKPTDKVVELELVINRIIE